MARWTWPWQGPKKRRRRCASAGSTRRSMWWSRDRGIRPCTVSLIWTCSPRRITSSFQKPGGGFAGPTDAALEAIGRRRTVALSTSGLPDRAGDRVAIRYDRSDSTSDRGRLVRPGAGTGTAAPHTRLCHRQYLARPDHQPSRTCPAASSARCVGMTFRPADKRMGHRVISAYLDMDDGEAD